MKRILSMCLILASMEHIDLEDMTLITAFYDQNQNMLKKEILKSSDGVKATYEIEDADHIKAFLYDGDDLTKKPYMVYEKKKTDYKIPEGDKIKVACIGDSLTYGTGATFSYPSELQKFLGYGYEVKNFGKQGCAITAYRPTTNPSYITTNEYTSSCEYLPNIVVIMLGANDIYEVYNEEKSEVFYTMYKELVQSYKNLSSNPEIYCVITPVDTWETDYVGLWQRPQITKVAKEENVNLVDMREMVTDKNLLSDFVHFTNKGYRIIANHISKAILDKINAVEISDDSVKINTQVVIPSNAYIVGYNGNEVKDVVIKQGPFTSGKDYDIDVSSFGSKNIDSVKVFFFGESLKPDMKYAKKSKGLIITGESDVLVKGNALAPNDIATVAVFDSNNEIIYIDTVKTDFSGEYEKTININNASEIYVDGTNIK